MSLVEEYLRKELKKLVQGCSKDQQRMFKRMYSNGRLDAPISEVVESMPAHKLDWAYQQVDRTLSSV